MARDEAALFGRGQTAGVTASTDLTSWEGVEKVFEDLDYTNPPKRRTNRKVLCRCVRNMSGIALLPKRLVSFKAGTNGTQVDGYARTIAAEGWPVDEWLPAAGVADKDLFWIVLQGPSNVLTALPGDATNVIVEGERLIAATAATSQATTAGRIRTPDYTLSSGTGSSMVDQATNYVGRALSAKTTANTNADVLVDVKGVF